MGDIETRENILSSQLFKKITVIVIITAGTVVLGTCVLRKQFLSSSEKMLIKFKKEARRRKSAAEIAEELIHSNLIQFPVSCTPVKSNDLWGFTNQISDFSSAIRISPIQGNVPFIAYIFELSENQSAGDFMNKLEAYANRNWHNCSTSNEMVVGYTNNKVLFVMNAADLNE